MSYLYIAPLENKNGLKIGKTHDLHERLKQLSAIFNFNQNEIKFVSCSGELTSTDLEKILHKTFKPFKIIENGYGNEFFTYNIIKDLLNTLNVICKIYNYQIESIDNTDIFVDYSKTDKILIHIGNIIKNRRLLLNIGQFQLASKAGVSRKTLCRIENGEKNNYNISLKTLVQIFNVLELTWIFNNLKELPCDKKRIP